MDDLSPEEIKATIAQLEDRELRLALFNCTMRWVRSEKELEKAISANARMSRIISDNHNN